MSLIVDTKNYQNPIIHSETSQSRKRSDEFVKSCFTDLVINSFFTGTACLFAATPQVAISLIVFTVAMVALSILAKGAALLWELNFTDQGKTSTFAETCSMVPFFNHGLLSSTTTQILEHEGGHYAAVGLLHQHPETSITIDSLFAGSTTWASGEYTFLGKLLGPLNSRLVIAAAGPLVAVCIATIGIILALHLDKSYPDLSKYLFFSANFSIIGHLGYAFSALSANPNDLSHDFVMLWHCGIHPLVSMISLIAIPIIAVLITKLKSNSL